MGFLLSQQETSPAVCQRRCLLVESPEVYFQKEWQVSQSDNALCRETLVTIESGSVETDQKIRNWSYFLVRFLSDLLTNCNLQ